MLGRQSLTWSVSLLRAICLSSCVMSVCNCQPLKFRPLTASDDSFVCVTDSPSPLPVSADDPLWASASSTPGVVRCAYFCTSVSVGGQCAGFNYFAAANRCTFYNKQLYNCSKHSDTACIFYGASSLTIFDFCRNAAAAADTTSFGSSSLSSGYSCTGNNPCTDGTQRYYPSSSGTRWYVECLKPQCWERQCAAGAYWSSTNPPCR